MRKHIKIFSLDKNLFLDNEKIEKKAEKMNIFSVSEKNLQRSEKLCFAWNEGETKSMTFLYLQEYFTNSVEFGKMGRAKVR